MDASMSTASVEITAADRLARIGKTLGALAAVLVFLAGASGCNKLKARDLLNKGVAAFKGGQYDAAVEDFKRAKDLDPELMNARLYLATAYANQYIPGAPSEQNLNFAKQAIQEYQDVLQKDPNNLTAIDGIGSLLYNMGGTPYDPAKFEESKSYHKKHIEIKPDDPEPYYWIGVIDWVMANRVNLELRAAYNKDHLNKQVKETEPLPASVRGDYTSKVAPLVDEGISSLNKALQLRPDYDDAMAYLSLLLRRKADMAESAEERDKLQQQADELLDKVKEIKQKRASQAPPTA
jgi:tetratricopeptide (TPR) repeat protein